MLLRRLIRLLRIACTAGISVLLAEFANAESADPLTHLVHVTASLAVDGHSISYDEYIECHPERTRTALPPDANRRFNQRRVYLVKPSPGGGAVAILVPAQFCYLWHHTWNPARSGIPEDRLSPHYLPIIYWVDDIARPTVIEAYFSEAYHEQRSRRVRLLSFSAVPGPFPVRTDALDRARRQEENDPPTDTIEARGCQSYCWRTVAVAPIHEAEWKQIPEMVEFLGQPSTNQLIALSAPQRNLLSPFKKNKIVNWLALSTGVPRQGEEHGLIGLPPRSQLSPLWRERLAATADELIPTRCEGDTCRPQFGQQGYVVFYRKENFQGPNSKFQWLELKGMKLNIRRVEAWEQAFFDPGSKTVFILAGARR